MASHAQDASRFHCPPNPLKPVDTKLPEGVVKGAVKLDPNIGAILEDVAKIVAQAPPSVMTDFDKKNTTLDQFIERVAVLFGLPPNGSSEYGLLSGNGKKCDEGAHFLTEETRESVKLGFILELTASPGNYAKILLSRLTAGSQKSDPNGSLSDLELLVKHSTDAAFAKAVKEQNGLDKLQELVEAELEKWAGRSVALCSSSSCSALLRCILLLLEHGELFRWSDIRDSFVKKIAQFVSGKTKNEEMSTLPLSLTILDNVVCYCGEEKLSLVREESLRDSTFAPIRHLEKSDRGTQLGALSLMNDIFARAHGDSANEISKLLRSVPVRSAIENNVLNPKVGFPSDAVSHQLGVLQKLLFNHLGKRADTQVSPDIDLERLHQFRRLVFDSGVHPLSPTLLKKTTPQQSHHAVTSKSGTATAREFHKLGFASVEHPLDEFARATPPGPLAIDCLLYYAEKHCDKLRNIVLINGCQPEGRAWPFATVCIGLVNDLANMLSIFTPPAEERERYRPLFFTTENPFEDLFCVFVSVFGKAWREMHATVDDIQKVITVADDQLRRALTASPTTFAGLEEELKKFSYSKMQAIWQQERQAKADVALNSAPIIQLREHLKPEVVQLVKSNRLNALKRGQRFQKGKVKPGGGTPKGAPQEYWFWQLDGHEKVFYFADCSETGCPVLEADNVDTQKLLVRDIWSFKTGRDCGHVLPIKNKKLTVTPLAFSIVCTNPHDRTEEGEELYFFTAPDEHTFTIWVDGLNALLGKDMCSESATSELNTLLDMELKIQLLNLDGIPDIATKLTEPPPAIPPLPTTFDWIKT